MRGTNAEVAQAWRNQSDERGRTPNGNFSFDGPTLISYRTPIAYLDREHKIAFFATRTYSVTTSGKHMNRASAPAGYLCIYPYEVSDSSYYVRAKTPEAMIRDAEEQLKENFKSLPKKRVYLPERVGAYNATLEIITEACRRLQIDPPNLPRIETEGFLFPLKDIIKDVVKSYQEDNKP